MKKILPWIIILAANTVAFAQTGGQYGPLPYKKVNETIGQKYIVLPLAKIDEKHGYDFLEINNAPAPKECATKTLTLTTIKGDSVQLTDSVGNVYKTHLYEGEGMPEVTLLSDLEDTRKMFLKKTLWLRTKELIIGDSYAHQLALPRENHSFEPVTVIDIIPGTINEMPISFILKLSDGKIGFVDCSTSGTNTKLNPNDQFDHQFFTEDPKLKYHFTPEVWKAVKFGYPLIGMSKDALRLVQGSPDHINTTTTGSTVSEQWVYGPATASSFFYFTNGKLTSYSQ